MVRVLTIGLLAVCALSSACPRKNGTTVEKKAGEKAGDVPLPPSRPPTPPAPAREPLPFLGDEGAVDMYGYPLRRVDVRKLREMLVAKKYNDLTAGMEDLQTSVELDFKKERLLADIIDAFGSNDATHEPHLDAWVAAFPGSFAPYAARGSYWATAAVKRRGAKVIKDTTPEQLSGMREAMTRADADFAQALAQRPQVVAVWKERIVAAQFNGSRLQRRQMHDAALKHCEECFVARGAYLDTLVPRWGGSYEEMDAYVAAIPEALFAKNPRLVALRGYAAQDQCDSLSGKNDQDALAACDRAIATTPHPRFLGERAMLYARIGRDLDAITDFERALTEEPYNADLRRRYAEALHRQKRFAVAEEAYRKALELEPDHAATRRNCARLIAMRGYEHARGGNYKAAIEEYERALEMDRENEYASKSLAQVRAELASDDDVERFLDVAKANPLDFALVRQADYALARRGRFKEILPLWDRYLAERPKDARAHFERGGTLHHLGDRAQMTSSMTAACELGLAEACKMIGKPAPVQAGNDE